MLWVSSGSAHTHFLWLWARVEMDSSWTHILTYSVSTCEGCHPNSPAHPHHQRSFLWVKQSFSFFSLVSFSERGLPVPRLTNSPVKGWSLLALRWPAVPVCQGLPRTWGFQCRNQEIPRQTRNRGSSWLSKEEKGLTPRFPGDCYNHGFRPLALIFRVCTEP